MTFSSAPDIHAGAAVLWPPAHKGAQPVRPVYLSGFSEVLSVRAGYPSKSAEPLA
jgi:hypothetical protein